MQADILQLGLDRSDQAWQSLYKMGWGQIFSHLGPKLAWLIEGLNKKLITQVKSLLRNAMITDWKKTP